MFSPEYLQVHISNYPPFYRSKWNVRDIQEPILILMLLIDAAHQRSRWRQDLINEDEDSLLGRELDALADDIDELAHGEVGRHKILLFVDGCDVGFFDFFAYHLGYARTLVIQPQSLLKRREVGKAVEIILDV